MEELVIRRDHSGVIDTENNINYCFDCEGYDYEGYNAAGYNREGHKRIEDGLHLPVGARKVLTNQEQSLREQRVYLLKDKQKIEADQTRLIMRQITR